MLERRAHLVDVEALALEQPQQQARVDAARARRHDEPLERREAHRRVDGAPVAHRGERRAGAEVARHDRAARAGQLAPRAATRRRARARGSRSGGRPSARATRAGPRTSPPPAASVAWNAVSKHATAGMSGQRGEHGVERGERLRLVQRREVGQRPQLAHARRRRPGPPTGSARRRGRPGGRRRRPSRRRRSTPRTRVLVDLRAAARRGRPRRRPRRRGSSTRSLRLLDPALTTRTRTRRDQPRRPAPSRAPPGCPRRLARVGAVAQALVDHLLAQLRRPLAEPGHAVDDVHHEVEAVEVVEHDHVERRRGRALLLVAADVEVARGSCAGR